MRDIKSNIFAKINSRINSFTNTEKRVAEYVLKNSKEVVHMSISDLADACHTAESSVYRFCKSLGLKGYQDFRIELVETLSSENETPYLSNKITLDDTIEELATKALKVNINALTETYNLINKEDIENAVEMLINANRVHFYGVGSSLMTALEANNKFLRITNKTECSIDSHLQIMSAALMTEQDVAVLISYSGSTKDIIEIAEVAKKRGAKLICITRFIKSPLTNYSDITLLCGANEGPLQGGSLSAKLSQLYLLDLLYLEYFRRTYNDSTLNKDNTAKAIIDKML